MKKDKMTINGLQNITHETKDRVTRTPLKPGGELGCSGRVSSSCSTSVNLVTNMVTSHEYQVSLIEVPMASMSYLYQLVKSHTI